MRHFLLSLSLLVAGCHKAPDLLPATEQYYYNGSTQVLNGMQRHDALAAYVVKTTALEVEITARTTYVEPFTPGATITAAVDGKTDTTFALAATSKEQYFTLQLPNTGQSHEIELTEGSAIRPYEHGMPLFTSLTGLSVPGGQPLTVVPIHRSTEGIVVFADSRSVGGAGNKTSRDAWPVVLRHTRRSDVYTIGYGSMQLGAHLNTATRQDSLTREISKRLAPYPVKILWVEAGINDYLEATFTPAQLTNYYQQWLPKVQAAIPGLRIFVQTDLWKKGEGPNKAGFSLPEYRQAEAAGAGANALVVDGRTLADSTTLQDGVHQTAAGDAGIAIKINALLGPRQ